FEGRLRLCLTRSDLSCGRPSLPPFFAAGPAVLPAGTLQTSGLARSSRWIVRVLCDWACNEHDRIPGVQAREVRRSSRQADSSPRAASRTPYRTRPAEHHDDDAGCDRRVLAAGVNLFLVASKNAPSGLDAKRRGHSASGRLLLALHGPHQ